VRLLRAAKNGLALTSFLPSKTFFIILNAFLISVPFMSKINQNEKIEPNLWGI